MNSTSVQGNNDGTNYIKCQILKFIPRVINTGLIPLSKVTKTRQGFDPSQMAFYLMLVHWFSKWKNYANR